MLAAMLNMKDFFSFKNWQKKHPFKEKVQVNCK